jgi:hypothetical protein
MKIVNKAKTKIIPKTKGEINFSPLVLPNM